MSANDAFQYSARLLCVVALAAFSAGCGLIPGSGADKAADEESGLIGKARSMVLAKFCERDLACDAQEAAQAVRALGAVLEQLPAQLEGLQVTEGASDDDSFGPSGSMPSGQELAGLMEMLKGMLGSEAFDDDEEDESDVRERMEAIAAMQAGMGSSATSGMSEVSAPPAGAEIIANLGGTPVNSGKLTPDELRQRITTPPSEE